MTVPGQPLAGEIALEWLRTRDDMVARNNVEQVFGTGTDKRRTDEFIKALDTISIRLVDSLGIHDPHVYDAFVELVGNGSTWVRRRAGEAKT